jgi:hypothetical protein
MWIGYPSIPFEIIFMQFNWISNKKTTQNSIFSPNAIEFMQIQTPSLNPMNWKFSNNNKSVPKFHYNSFYLNELSMKKLFSITFSLLVETLWNQFDTPLFIENLTMTPKAW